MVQNKISVIVPVYNIEYYVKKAIESIQQQTYRNVEIILIDDGSTDGSGEILDFFADRDSRVSVIHKCNGGVTEARLKGIEVAVGDWIGFVDGDDYIEPSMYETLMNKALQYHADISHCGYKMIFPSRVDYYYNTNKIIIQNHHQGLKDLLSGEYVEPGLWNKLIKSEIVKSVIAQNQIDTSITINEDLLMNYYFFDIATQSVYQDVCPYHYILRKGSAATSGLSPNKLYDPVKVQKILLTKVKDDYELADIIYGRLATLYISGASMKNPEKVDYIDEFINYCQSELKYLKSELFNGRHGKSICLKYRLCSFSPQLFRWIHSFYARARGTNNKYEVR